MDAVVKHANNGGFVMGICNGFQILCESGLLPGALLRNENQLFVCENVYLKCNNSETAISHLLNEDQAYKIPIAHAEGRYYASDETLAQLQANNQIVFSYCNAAGEVTPESNPNGSKLNIAGIANEGFNVYGMMPHPERAASADLFNKDGLAFFEALLTEVSA